MLNPWECICLEDYENHMQLSTVMQLQAMNDMMRDQLFRYAASSVMILGVAGGNGLNHVVPGNFEKIYGVDINADYLTACRARYCALGEAFEPIKTDLTLQPSSLPHAELLIANLLVEYIGHAAFKSAVAAVTPCYVSCAIQINTGSGFVSDSPYLHVFDRLEEVYHPVSQERLTQTMADCGYALAFLCETPLPKGKKLLRLDYEQQKGPV